MGFKPHPAAVPNTRHFQAADAALNVGWDVNTGPQSPREMQAQSLAIMREAFLAQERGIRALLQYLAAGAELDKEALVTAVGDEVVKRQGSASVQQKIYKAIQELPPQTTR